MGVLSAKDCFLISDLSTSSLLWNAYLQVPGIPAPSPQKETKIHVVKAMIFPVVMHRCDSWIIKKAEH